MAEGNDFCIKEIVCLRSKLQKTGRARVITPSDVDGDTWERLVDVATAQPKHFEIHRDLVQTQAEKTKDFDNINVGTMFTMAREKVAEIAEYYGIVDTGQGRAALIDQIRAERLKQKDLLAREALGEGAGN